MPTQQAERTRRRNIFRRHLALTTLGTVLLVLLLAAGSFGWYLNHELGSIRHFDAGITPYVGPNGSTSDAGRPLNVLVLGSSSRHTNSVADDLADGRWTRGVHASDTIMLVHIPADRQSAQVVSIPRDSWVPVPSDPDAVGGMAQIDAAFSWGGPALVVKTVQQLTHLRVDHVAMIDWNGFKDLVDVIGGVRLYIPHAFTDRAQHVTWQRGWQTLNGYQALQYVRTRHGLVDGDFGRIQRQQNFLRTALGDVLSSSTFANPVTLAQVIGTFADFVEVDDTWTSGDLRSLAFAMRNVGGSDVTFATAPLGRYDTVAGQDVVRLDRAKSRVMWRDFEQGRLRQYVAQHPGSALPGDTSIR